MPADESKDPMFGFPTISTLTSLLNPFTLPLPSPYPSAFASFNSNLLISTSPFTPTAFSPFSIASTPLQFIPHSLASYSETVTTGTHSNIDHLTVSLGVTVGVPFLNAGLKGTYANTVLKDENSFKRSQHATILGPTVTYASPPLLSSEAKSILITAGEEAFRERFGDYFVSGYQLGAETAMTLSCSAMQRSEKQDADIKATVDFFFYSAEKTLFAISSVNQEAAATLELTAFDTLTGARAEKDTMGGEIGMKQGIDFGNLVNTIQTRFEEKLAGLTSEIIKMEAGDGKWNEAGALMKEGIVNGLWLSPWTTLGEFVTLRTR